MEETIQETQVISSNNELSVMLDQTPIKPEIKINFMQALGSYFEKAVEYSNILTSIEITEPKEVEKMELAKSYRLKLVKIRTSAKTAVDAKREFVQSQMADYQLEDKLWLKSFQMIEAVSKNLEAKFKEKEEFAIRWEADNRAKLKTVREDEVIPYQEFMFAGMELGNLSEVDYQKFLSGLKVQLENKIQSEVKAKAEAEAKAKAEAEAKLKADEERRLAIAENERLKAEAVKLKEESDAKLKAEKEAQAKILAEQKIKDDETKREAYRLKCESDSVIEKALQLKKIAEAEKAKVDAENAKLKADKAKAEANAKAIKEKQEKEAEAIANAEKELAKDDVAWDRARLIEFGKAIAVYKLGDPVICKTKAGADAEYNFKASLSIVLSDLRESLKEIK